MGLYEPTPLNPKESLVHRTIGFLTVLLALRVTSVAGQRPPETAAAILDSVISRVGGASLLADLHTMRLDVLTQWLKTSFATTPFPELSSYERNAELRDYAKRHWRNTRHSGVSIPTPMNAMIDIVRDTVGYRRRDSMATPLNRAYVNERRELFVTAVDQLLPGMRSAPDLRILGDTIVDGARVTRLAATVSQFALSVLVHRDTGLPLAVRFMVDEADDFGLAQWGRHEFSTWYSRWRRLGTGLLLPHQVDVLRVGRPYKRMTYLSLTPNAPAPPDSFAIPDSMVSRYLTTQQRPMWDVPVQTEGVVEEGHFAKVPGATGSLGAVHVGGQWVVFETAQHPEAMAQIAAWLATATPAIPVGLGIATLPTPANGGAAWFVANGLPMVVGPGSRPIVEQITGPRGLTVVTNGRWLRVGSDSLWVEPVSAPDFVGALAVYVPSRKWLYLPFAGMPAAQRTQAAILAEYARRGWPVELIGSARVLRRAVQ
jgi:hypothetical protein